MSKSNKTVLRTALIIRLLLTKSYTAAELNGELEKKGLNFSNVSFIYQAIDDLKKVYQFDISVKPTESANRYIPAFKIIYK